MSFITKRERVFNEYDLFDLPPRNEGKLKAYASCTDARAWSHFGSDKTEHLVEIIKRNNETCRTKYVPTDVIVETLMVAKNAEIARLKHKIEEFEQMLAAYDQLDLTCDQKCEIANAHAAIKAANKELDELCLDLDLSGFTEGIDSEAFETGKSRGDEPNRFRGDQMVISKGSESAKSRGDEWSFGKDSTPKMESKSNQAGLCHCDASTSAYDPRIQEMQEAIISKDAKLSAMQNTIAVMENDVCEPYCIYAHIYTALEKIFGVLCQNQKYKLYLSLMTAGKDTRCIDIKGKILFKLKVLEKFSLALIAPCSQEMRESPQESCACLRAEVVARLDFPSLSEKPTKPSLDSKRAQLVADIMENDEMKELLVKDSMSDKHDDEQTDDGFGFDTYSIDTENLKRLKNLQENYDDLMTCYEKLKYEKDGLQTRCHKYEELEKEFDNLKDQLREYNVLWTEKEHYRKRSMDIDSLKEQYLILAEETSNIETQLKAESEINHMKSITIEELRSENIALEKKINEAFIAFEKEKNSLQCKLKETECTVMCQDQQIKSLSIQIDKLLEQSHDKMQDHEGPTHSLVLIDEIESLKEQIKNLKDALFCSEEEKQNLQDEFQDKLKIINELRMEIEDWKSTYEKTIQRNEYLEKYTDNFRDKVHRLIEENRKLSEDVDEKTVAVENLINVMNNRSEEVKKLTEEIERKDNEQKMLHNQIDELREMYHHNMSTVEKEKIKVLESLQLARQESQELLAKVVNENDGMSKTLEAKAKDYDELKNVLKNTMEQNKSLQMDLISRENNNSILLQEIQRLREINAYAIDNISDLQDQKNEYKASLELTRKESQTLEDKLLQLENITKEIDSLKETCKILTNEKEKLENELQTKKLEVETALKSLKLCKKESEELKSKLTDAQNWEEQLTNLSRAHEELMNEKRTLQSELTDKRKNFDNLLESLSNKNELILKTSQKVGALENELINLKQAHDDLLREKNILQNDFDNKTKDLNNLYNNLESKIEENRELLERIKELDVNQKTTQNNVIALENEHIITQNTLNAIQKESAALIDKLKNYENLESEYEKLKFQNECLKNELSHQMTLFKQLQRENNDICSQNQNLLLINEQLENSLMTSRKLIENPGSSNVITYEDILKELEDVKKEKLRNHNKIKDLLNRLDDKDNIISNLSEDILARDDKVAILENHINHLEDEIRNLHHDLDDVISTGESIKDNSFIQMDTSLKTMEAHHSKAAHNMKLELAKLQNEYSMLEQQLSVTKLKTEESSRDKNKYLSQVVHLQNEREIIVSDIKQLELKSVGDSNLSPNQCQVEDILGSLERIRKSIEAKSSKSSCLEQTILKVQTSSQLLLTKADEAKKLVEKEKQKIIMEKEDAIRDRLNMEKKVDELKHRLDNQITNDARIIKDLEANILNQRLLNEHTISKLKEELSVLQSSYENSTSALNALEDKVNQLTEENEKYLRLNEKLNMDLDLESKEKEILQNKLEDYCNKPIRNIGIQVQIANNYRNNSSQTETLDIYSYENSFPLSEPDITGINKIIESNAEMITNTNMSQINKPSESKKVSNLLPTHNPHSINEVQILTANIEPSFDFVRNSYLNYKIPRLSPGRLEQYSISNINLPENSLPTQNENFVDINTENPNLIDIYNRPIQSTSSKIIENEVDNVTVSKQDPQSATGINAFGFDFTNDNFKNQNQFKDTMFFEPTSQESADADLFVIYKDSGSNYGNDNHDKKAPFITLEQADKITESNPNNRPLEGKYKKNQAKQHKEKKAYFQENELYTEEEENEDDSVKPKLNIKLPRVEHDSRSIAATSDGDKKSLDSYTLGIYSSPKQSSFTDIKLQRDLDLIDIKQDTPSLPTISYDGNQNLGSYNSLGLNSEEDINFIRRHEMENRISDTPQQSDKRIKIIRNEVPDDGRTNQTNKLKNQNNVNEVSHHKLSRVGADVYLIKSKNILQDTEQQKPKKKATKQSRDFALNYILDSVQLETNPSSPGTLSGGKDLRKSKSDEIFNFAKTTVKSVPSKHSPLKVSSLEYKTISSPSRSFSKISDKTQSKSLVERSVMAKIEDLNSYESKIKYLTKALENTEKDYKKRLDAIKIQYDMNIKNILTEHNLGVRNIQGLHEETLQDIIKIHENEIENLRTMSIEANRKAEKLEKENRLLKSKIQDHSSTTGLDEEPIKITPDIRKRRKSRIDTKTLTKTNVEAFNVKPKIRSQGPCTCSLDANISDTIRNIFEQVDVDQRKMAEHTYVKYIANKIINGNVEALDAQELSFLHLRVCRTWKTKLTKEEALQKRIDSLESELIHKQRHAQQHIAELDRKVAEERRRLQEVREAVCRGTPVTSRNNSPQNDARHKPPVAPPSTAEKDFVCNCNTETHNVELGERRSAGDLLPGASVGGLKQKRPRPESNRAVLAKIDTEERREKKLYHDEPPTRLRRSHDRSGFRYHKK